MNTSRLSGSRGYRLGLIAAVIVGLPILGFGFFGDDYLFLATLAGDNPLGTPLDLFVFGTGDADQVSPLMLSGPYPWFGDPEFRARFFRPLACLLMGVEHRLFGHWAPGYNAHSFLWHLVLCAAAMLVFRRVLPPAVGALALLLFVVDESHAFPTAWWSNRHAIMAAAFGFLGLAAHVRARTELWRPGRPLSLFLFSLSLLSAETGLCALAYVLAYEAFGATDAKSRRLFAVLPAALLAILYFVWYRWSGYGAQFSDIYIDPGAEPLAFLRVAPGRFLMLAGAQFLSVPVEVALLKPALDPLFALIGGGALGAVAWALFVAWPRLQQGERHALRWLIPGAALAVTPTLAAIVNSRVLVGASLGGAAVIAAIAVGFWRALREQGVLWAHRFTMRALLAGIIVVHLIVAALSWPGQVFVLNRVMAHLNDLIRESELDESRIEASQVIIINAPEPYSGLYPLMLRSFDGLPAPRAWWTLSFAPFAHRLTRTGPLEMQLDVVDGQMLTSVLERLFRSSRRPLAPGYAIDLGGLRIEVLETGDLGPSSIRLEFAEPPESESYQLLVFRDGGYRRIVPPEIGQRLDLPHSL